MELARGRTKDGTDEGARGSAAARDVTDATDVSDMTDVTDVTNVTDVTDADPLRLATPVEVGYVGYIGYIGYNAAARDGGRDRVRRTLISRRTRCCVHQRLPSSVSSYPHQQAHLDQQEHELRPHVTVTYRHRPLHTLISRSTSCGPM